MKPPLPPVAPPPPAPLDVAVVGAGPAGAAAAFHLARHHLALTLFDPEPPGGMTRAARRIDNLPGHPGGIPGPAYARLLAEGIAASGIPLRPLRIEAIRRLGDGTFEGLAGGEPRFVARAVIVATGTAGLPLAGEFPPAVDPALVERDAARFHGRLDGQAVLVVGGGETAADTALTAADRGARVTLACRGEAPRGNPRLLAELAASTVAVRCGATLAAAAGRPGEILATFADGAAIACARLVVCIGRVPSLPDFPPEPERQGIFVAGDATGRLERYVAPALADGTLAAASALRFLGVR